MKSATPSEMSPGASQLTTFEAARLLGMAVRSVQLMVDRNELQAWKTPGGHRRISRESVAQWLHSRSGGALQAADPQATQRGRNETSETAAVSAQEAPGWKSSLPRKATVLLIEDSVHFQNLVTLLMEQHFPAWQLHIANDGITGLAMYGQIQPDLLIVDILLPGIDGGALITTLRTHSQFAKSRLIVVTSLDESQRAPYAFALRGVDVIHKPRLVAELPALLAQSFQVGASS